MCLGGHKSWWGGFSDIHSHCWIQGGSSPYPPPSQKIPGQGRVVWGRGVSFRQWWGWPHRNPPPPVFREYRKTTSPSETPREALPTRMQEWGLMVIPLGPDEMEPPLPLEIKRGGGGSPHGGKSHWDPCQTTTTGRIPAT